MRVLVSRRVLIASAVVAAAAALASRGAPAAHPRITTTLTWDADIHPILQRRCVACHRTGGIAPMSFEEYESARPWARAIREEVLERRMPPTAIRSGAGLYENARTLSIGEMELLAAWVDGGAPNGTEPWLAAEGGALVPKPAPPSPVAAVTPWDVTLEGKAVAVAEPTSPLTHRVTFAAPAGWIGAWTIDAAGLPARSALLTVGAGEPFGSWAPDEAPVQYPDHAGVRLERGATIEAEFTLTAAADEAERNRARPRLKLLSRPDARERVVSKRVGVASAPMTAGDTLLALRLGLGNAEGSADVILTRQNGDHIFLMAMGPPGVPDPNTYRLRVPMPLGAGDTIRVVTEGPFELDLEMVRATQPSRTRRR